MFSRKAFLSLAVVVILVAGVTTTGTWASTGSKKVEGSWLVTVSPEGQPPFLNLATFTKHGALITAANDGSGGAGEWRKMGKRRVGLTFMLLFPDPGLGLIRFKVRSNITLNKKGDRWRGEFVAEAFNQNIPPDGVVLFSFPGTVEAERIVVEPL